MATERSSDSTFEEIPCLRAHSKEINGYMGRRPKRSVRILRDRFDDFAEWAREVEHHAELAGRPRMVLKIPIEPSDLAAYVEWLDSDRGLALSTIRSYLSSLGALHIAARLFNPVTSDPVKNAMAELRNKRSEVELRRARALSDDELQIVLAILPARRRTRGRQLESVEGARKRASVDRALLLTMVHAGMRRSEAADLTWGEVQQREDGSGMILLPVNWGIEDYLWVPIDQEPFQALMDIKPEDADRNSRVFNLSGSQVNRRLKRMCEEAGIDSTDISGYTPRATLNRFMVEEGAPVNTIAAQLRLKPPNTLAMYIHPYRR